MFKKDRDLAERNKCLLKNKEVRTLKADVLKQFPSLSEEDINGFIPNKAQIEQTKLVSRTVLYSLESRIIFFDLHGRNDLYPTLFTLFRFPGCMRTFSIFSPVSEFVLRGADLMLPGVHSVVGLEGLREGEKVCIKVIGNPLPFAVGYSETNEMMVKSPQRKGKAVSVVHFYGDELLGREGLVAPNAGFTARCVLPLDEEYVVLENSGSSSGGGGGGGGGNSSDASCSNTEKEDDQTRTCGNISDTVSQREAIVTVVSSKAEVTDHLVDDDDDLSAPVDAIGEALLLPADASSDCDPPKQQSVYIDDALERLAFEALIIREKRYILL
jgi:predicted RNA-binding protein (TIGR00451 family)